MKKVLGLFVAASCVFSAGILYVVMTTGMVSPPIAESVLTPAPASIVELPTVQAPVVEEPQAVPPPVKRAVPKPLAKKEEAKEEADAGHHCVQRELSTGGTVMVCEYE